MIQHCDIKQLTTDVLIEHIKTRPAMCMDHRLITRVMETEDCMRIFGLINPCIVTKKYIIIKREWIEKMKNDKLEKNLFVQDKTNKEIEKGLQEIEQECNVSNCWAVNDLNCAE